MSESSTGTTENQAVGTGLAEIERRATQVARWTPGADEDQTARDALALADTLRKIKALGDESPIQFVRRHGIDPSAGGAVFLAAARADVLAVLREAGL